jgi:hypothetical protein
MYERAIIDKNSRETSVIHSAREFDGSRSECSSNFQCFERVIMIHPDRKHKHHQTMKLMV